MDALRAVYESLGLQNPQTYIQSGNVIFKTRGRDLAQLARQIETAIEHTFGFRPDVILRTTSDLRDVIAKNPFAGRNGLDPRKLLVTFLTREPDPQSREKALQIKADPEELHIQGREAYIYFPNGMARPKLSLPSIEKMLKVSGTGRNWNTVLKLYEIAQSW